MCVSIRQQILNSSFQVYYSLVILPMGVIPERTYAHHFVHQNCKTVMLQIENKVLICVYMLRNIKRWISLVRKTIIPFRLLLELFSRRLFRNIAVFNSSFWLHQTINLKQSSDYYESIILPFQLLLLCFCPL